jgi:hypothetical protein
LDLWETKKIPFDAFDFCCRNKNVCLRLCNLQISLVIQHRYGTF